MTQSRLMSLVEAVANTAIGYLGAVATQFAVFPLCGIELTLARNMALGAVFTGASVVRGYVLRRLFEAIRLRVRALEEVRCADANRCRPA